MLTSIQKKEINHFLDKLQIPAKGRIIVANMLASIADNLVPGTLLSAFLLDCVQTLNTNPETDPVIIIEDVSNGFGVARTQYLRKCRQNVADEENQLSCTVNTVTFHNYLLDDKYKEGGTSGLPTVLPLIPDNTNSSLNEYQVRLSEVTANSKWKKPTATLGKPYPNALNCWITSDQFGEDSDAPEYINDSSSKARDELGLIDCNEGTCLIRLSFLASSISKTSKIEIARPAFPDCGNSRFRVNQPSTRSNLFADHGWGTTVHLGKFGDKDYTDSTGVCERVTSALPLIDLKDVNIEFLGIVIGDRGLNAHDDHKAFAKELEKPHDKKSTKDKLIALLK